MVSQLDAFILGQFQRLSTWIETTFGVSVFGFARLLLIVFATGASTYYVSVGTPVDYFLAGATVLVGAMLFFEISAIERLTRDGQFRNPLHDAPAERANRLIQLGVSLSGVPICLLAGRVRTLDVAFVALWACVNVKACNTLPPSERRAFWEAWGRKTEAAQ